MNSRQRRKFKRYLEREKKKLIEEHRQGKRGLWIYQPIKGGPVFYAMLGKFLINVYGLGEKVKFFHRTYRPASNTKMIEKWEWDCLAPYEELKSIEILEECSNIGKIKNGPAFHLKGTNFYCFSLLGRIYWVKHIICESASELATLGLWKESYLRVEFELVYENLNSEIQEHLVYHLELFEK